MKNTFTIALFKTSPIHLSALNVKEFLQVMHDILLGAFYLILVYYIDADVLLSAMSKAYDTAGLLHRDLSIRNAMIDCNGRGVLNGWNHAGSTQELAAGL